MDYEENFKYRLRTVNNTNETFRHFVLYDKLPVKGDIHGFANIVTGPVVAPDGFKVYYNTGSDLPDNPAEGVNADGWVENVDDYSKVTALKIVMVNPEVIEPGEDINFDVPMKSPAYEESGELNGKISSNTYYVNRDAADLANFWGYRIRFKTNYLSTSLFEKNGRSSFRSDEYYNGIVS